MSGAFDPFNRREFLRGISTTALLAAAHPILAMTQAAKRRPWAAPNGIPLITGLRLVTSVSLSTMKDFYHGVLGLPVLAEGPTEITIAGGQTPITFANIALDSDAPFYHFAFNIPENKLLAAREWQAERTPLIPPYPRLRDSRYPKDVVHFQSWNSHSVFFWDPAGNLLEYIARHDLNNGAPGGFTSEDILYASEIAMVVDDVSATAARLRETFGLEQYRRGSEVFTAVGDESGLLLVMKRGRVLGFDEGKGAGVYPTAATIRGKAAALYTVPEFPYEVSVRNP